jgi:LacI family transcriptional regulator
MAQRERTTLRGRPHVALIVETSLGAGREILRGIAQYVREHGPWSIYHEPRNLEDSAPTWLKGWRGDGIIVRLQNKRITSAVVDAKLPAVDVLGAMPHPAVPLVHVRDASISRLAAEHLLERGFRNFGYCGIEGANWSKQREEAFVGLVGQAGCACSVYHLPAVSRTDHSWEAEQQDLAEWVSQLPRPAGVMVCHDPRGQRVLEACRRANVTVPEEVAVIGVDNDEPICEVSAPPLSSVIPDFRGIGYQAAALLDRLMHGEPQPEGPMYLEPLGVAARLSTDALALEDRDVADAMRFIRQHACDRIGVEDVAKHVSLSRSVLKRRFRKSLDRSVHDEIIRVRIKRVQELLAQTDLPIGLIAQKTGFRHQEYLGVAFRAQVGQTPGAYRRQYQSGPKSTNFGPRSP